MEKCLIYKPISMKLKHFKVTKIALENKVDCVRNNGHHFS